MNRSTFKFKECYDYLSEKSERWAAILNENASDKETLDDETADAIARADHSFRPIGNKKALAQKRKREAIVIDDDGEEIDPIEALIKETKKLNDRAEERAAKIAKHLQEDQEIRLMTVNTSSIADERRRNWILKKQEEILMKSDQESINPKNNTENDEN
ncbi:hypothetical protein MUCCIDRAFT_75643 [Mucor lusitanicus CBS 277.49]|uniref:No apical meristem-associated C-terminal domain-containing protein n=1 Tax=Mucor lusitanicus CBS 277.49 TaxID=747725 RepID=A0A168HB66_MUCCL|nr:hypothetical protein MUCCIDRAFT_75643 [Mucor lusitanicus CBS 277.49]